MRIEFCDSDGGEVRLEKDSEELKDIINSITTVGTEVNLMFGEDDFLRGYVDSVMYSYDEVDKIECLKIFISEIYYSKYHKIISEIESIRKLIELNS